MSKIIVHATLPLEKGELTLYRGRAWTIERRYFLGISIYAYVLAPEIAGTPESIANDLTPWSICAPQPQMDLERRRG